MNSLSTYYTGYEDDDESSIEDGCKSSDEEVEAADLFEFLKTKQIQPKLNKKEMALEFENEMNSELDKLVDAKQKDYLELMKQVEGQDKINPEEQNKTSKKAEKPPKKEEQMESDTDSEAELETGVRTKKKREFFTNDELFYDPDMDDEDEKWINEKRNAKKSPIKSTDLKSILKNSKSNASNVSVANTSQCDMTRTDAVLNCPCCMTMLSMDCQRHEKYPTQYRAMFVFNCKVKEDEQLKYPKSGAQKKKVKAELQEYEFFKPVGCESCKTEVGVFDDKQEVYYFFNVLASHS